jgi:hypothetical protein
MFLIMGINQKEVKLNFNQFTICKCCGKYGHVEVFMSYTYFMLFFIPIIKWNRQYYVRMSCCGSVAQLNEDMGRAIEKGQVTEINMEQLNFGYHENRVKCCTNCGFTTMEEFQYCPKCGRLM